MGIFLNSLFRIPWVIVRFSPAPARAPSAWLRVSISWLCSFISLISASLAAAASCAALRASLAAWISFFLLASTSFATSSAWAFVSLPDSIKNCMYDCLAAWIWGLLNIPSMSPPWAARSSIRAFLTSLSFLAKSTAEFAACSAASFLISSHLVMASLSARSPLADSSSMSWLYLAWAARAFARKPLYWSVAALSFVIEVAASKPPSFISIIAEFIPITAFVSAIASSDKSVNALFSLSIFS